MIQMFFPSCRIKLKTRLLEQQESICVLNSLDMASFSRCVVSRLVLMGYTPVSSQSASSLNSSMVKMVRNGEMYFLFISQNKRITTKHIRLYANILFTEGIYKGIVVSTGIFSPRNRRIAQNQSLELIDGKDLLYLMGRYSHDGSGPHVLPEACENASDSVHSLILSKSPACPLCGSSLSIHLGSKNGRHGKTFWKCRQSSKCGGLYPYAMETLP